MLYKFELECRLLGFTFFLENYYMFFKKYIISLHACRYNLAKMIAYQAEEAAKSKFFTKG